MSLRLYDTAARAVRDFTPLRAGRASVYVCGLTVQGPPHVGHVRAALAFDVLRRWLTADGLDVTYVRNVTDIDDKILNKAAEHGVPWWAWAFENERACTRAYDVLGVLPPTYEPRATGHVTDMVTLMQRLIERGHAYAVDGDVYFDVRSFPQYGELTGQKLEDLQPAGDTDTDTRKRDPRDFALWKAHKDGEPETAAWPTPWGSGRPGWHLECSAMAGRYLGAEFDIHGGGLDLRFPHHENEQAQSRAAGDGFARYWLHNGWVTLGGEKMSKSLGNTALVDEVVRRVRPVELRYYLVAPHYRSTIEFTDAALAEAAAAYQRIESFVRRAAERVGAGLGRRRAPRPSSARPSTTTWARRPRSPRSTRPSGRATAPWPPTTTPRPPPRSAPCGRCSACSAWTRSTRSGPTRAAATTGWSRPPTAWSPSRSSSGRPPAPARTSRRPTPSATSSPPSASPSRTPRTDPDGS